MSKNNNVGGKAPVIPKDNDIPTQETTTVMIKQSMDKELIIIRDKGNSSPKNKNSD